VRVRVRVRVTVRVRVRDRVRKGFQAGQGPHSELWRQKLASAAAGGLRAVDPCRNGGCHGNGRHEVPSDGIVESLAKMLLGEHIVHRRRSFGPGALVR
jgi:hypothetical protein